MPQCGSQIHLCDIPIHFDTYKGCSHGCKYCFSYRKGDISQVTTDETFVALMNFTKGQRGNYTKWCDWNIPLHWGGMSDPFQPWEVTKRNSYKCLEVFAETQYPFVVSTKSVLPARQDYYDLFSQCNCVFQMSMLCSGYDKLEAGAPTYNERLKAIEKMSKTVKRTIVRLQPYILDYHSEIKANIPHYKDIGVHGVVVEGIKMFKKIPGMVKVGGDLVYPKARLRPYFEEIKDLCYKYGLAFYCGENRLREIGDDLCCCGCADLEGFNVNKANLNHYLYDKENYTFTPKMNEAGTAGCFLLFRQHPASARALRNKISYKDAMTAVTKDSGMVSAFLGD